MGVKLTHYSAGIQKAITASRQEMGVGAEGKSCKACEQGCGSQPISFQSELGVWVPGLNVQVWGVGQSCVRVQPGRSVGSELNLG